MTIFEGREARMNLPVITKTRWCVVSLMILLAGCDVEQKEYASKTHHHDGSYSPLSHSHTAAELPTSSSFNGTSNSNRIVQLNTNGRVAAGLSEQSLKPIVRFTRDTLSATASDSTKDSACETRFGSEYVAAAPYDLAFYGSRVTGLNITAAGNTSCWTLTNNSQVHNIAISGTACASPRLMCILKEAPFRTTRATLSTGATNGDLDSLCESNIGARFKLATQEDLMSASNATGANLWVHGPNIRSINLNLSWFSFEVGAGSSPAHAFCVRGD